MCAVRRRGRVYVHFCRGRNVLLISFHKQSLHTGRLRLRRAAPAATRRGLLAALGRSGPLAFPAPGAQPGPKVSGLASADSTCRRESS
jgi:hypothetical protein